MNLIGEHTDYNDGFVMPAAIDFSTWAAIAARYDRKLLIHSENFGESAEVDLEHLPATRAGRWSDYVVGVAKTLSQSGCKLTGANLLLDGDVPQGAGLSSSAAVEVAAAFALLSAAGSAIELRALALLCQRAENEFVGARCGIMDQFISCHGKAGYALRLDCRSLEFRPLPLPPDVRLIVCNTMVRHSVAGGEYNRRREECEEGVRSLAKHLPAVRALRDVKAADLMAYRDQLPEIILRRCRHVVSENERVQNAASALERRDLATFGKLMRQSHQSLRDDFAVSCRELDLMVDLAEKVTGVYGARMTGGGFGGCTINLVSASRADLFQQTVSEAYKSVIGRAPEIYVSAAAGGVDEVTDF